MDKVKLVQNFLAARRIGNSEVISIDISNKDSEIGAFETIIISGIKVDVVINNAAIGVRKNVFNDTDNVFEDYYPDKFTRNLVHD